jgi:hypothetical protein
MLARRLTTILPAMTLAEAIETTRIHRVAGLTGDRTALVTTRPCRAPHHTISDAGLIGGRHVPMPGEVSLAHHEVRCLEARPACGRYVLEGWRPPLEGGVIYRQSPARHRPASVGRPCVTNAAWFPPRETRGPHRVVPCWRIDTVVNQRATEALRRPYASPACSRERRELGRATQVMLICVVALNVGESYTRGRGPCYRSPETVGTPRAPPKSRRDPRARDDGDDPC